MQDRLFDQVAPEPEVDPDHDPYAEFRAAGERLSAEFGIEPERATNMVLSFGSEASVRRVLVQRWLLGEDERKAA